MEGFTLATDAKSGKKKSRLNLRDDESESEDESNFGKNVKVSGFSSKEGAIHADGETKKPSKKEYIIKPQSNQDWQEAARKRIYVPETHDQDIKIPENDSDLKYGLNKAKPSEEEQLQKAEHEDDDEGDEEEELPRLSEHQAYERDVKSRPDAPSMSDYGRLPVEEFGSALLRGMGYDPEDEKGTNNEVKLRPALLGLGAKEVKSDKQEELGAWGKSTAKGQTKAEKSYVPLQKIDKQTGKPVDVEPEERESHHIDYRSDHRSRYRDDRRDQSSRYESSRRRESNRYDSDRRSGSSRYESSRHHGRDRDRYRSERDRRDRDRERDRYRDSDRDSRDSKRYRDRSRERR